MDSLPEGLLVILAAIAVSVLIAKTVKRVRSDQRMIVERLGKHSRTCGQGWHLLVPLVDRGILLQLDEIAPGWKGYGEEELRRKLVQDFYQKANRDVPARVVTKASDSATPGGQLVTPGERLAIFAFFVGLYVLAFIVELKTGYHLDHPGRHGVITQIHGTWSWDEVWAHLPDELSGLFFLPFIVLAFLVVEMWARFSRKK